MIAPMPSATRTPPSAMSVQERPPSSSGVFDEVLVVSSGVAPSEGMAVSLGSTVSVGRADGVGSSAEIMVIGMLVFDCPWPTW